MKKFKDLKGQFRNDKFQILTGDRVEHFRLYLLDSSSIYEKSNLSNIFEIQFIQIRENKIKCHVSRDVSIYMSRIKGENVQRLWQKNKEILILSLKILPSHSGRARYHVPPHQLAPSAPFVRTCLCAPVRAPL